MRTLLNILWFIFGGGFLIWLSYVAVGVLLCISIVGIPFGVQCFKIAGLGAFPFGKDIQRDGTVPIFGALGNVMWFILAGVWIFIEHAGLAVCLALSIIGIPFAIQHIKLAMLALWPFGNVAVVAVEDRVG
jgi:uncharacterized membrane protein YccF (DUF307 family)